MFVQIGPLDNEIFAKTYFLKFSYTFPYWDWQIAKPLRNLSIYKNKYNFSE